MWVLGNRPPLTKKIFTPSKTIAAPTKIMVKINVFTAVFSKKYANLKKVSEKLPII